MIIEIEKKYELTDDDYKIIKEKCNFVSKKEIIDKYYDTKDYKLFKLWYKYRIRNWKTELKLRIDDPIKKFSRSNEYSDLKTINSELSKLGLKSEDLNEILVVITNREKYNYMFKWINFIIDIDKYKYWERYEIELNFDDDSWIDVSKIIDDFRKHLWLTWKQKIILWKTWICAKNENKEFYIVINEFYKIKN